MQDSIVDFQKVMNPDEDYVHLLTTDRNSCKTVVGLGVFVTSLFLKRWDYLFLKPAHFLFVLRSILCFVEGRWGVGTFLLVVSIWGVGGIGQNLYPQLSAKEMCMGKDATTKLGATAGSVYFLQFASLKLITPKRFSVFLLEGDEY